MGEVSRGARALVIVPDIRGQSRELDAEARLEEAKGLALAIGIVVAEGIVLPVRAVGAMPLSAYTAQLVIWAIAAAVILGDPSDLQGFRDLDPFWPITGVLIVAATVWALTIGRGPLEAATDRVTRVLVPGRADTTGETRLGPR